MIPWQLCADDMCDTLEKLYLHIVWYEKFLHGLVECFLDPFSGFCKEGIFLNSSLPAGCPKPIVPVCVATVEEMKIQLPSFLHSCIGQTST